jgi:hypothetical protein
MRVASNTILRAWRQRHALLSEDDAAFAANVKTRGGRGDGGQVLRKGCTVDALAPGCDEGRGKLRKAPVSCRQAFDPGISEWGNPTGGNPRQSAANT